ncbi:MAG: hypothetical protein M1167_05970, partial [Chloroflexi bacterium]|nr:hypothetical protein [Chloroflexota bacterium]
MDKVKAALTVLTVAIVVAPLLGVVYIYRDNLLGLVLPPQINDAKNGGLADLSDLSNIVGSDIT